MGEMSDARIITVGQLALILEEKEVICVMEDCELVATVTKDPVYGITCAGDINILDMEAKSLCGSLNGNIVAVI